MSNNFMPSFCLKQKNMLRFLKNYKRVSRPCSAEFNIYDEVENLPEIARWRLPLLTNNYTDMEEVLPSQMIHVSVATRIVDSEVNFQNYSKWLEAPQIDHLDARTICSIAIKHGVSAFLSDVKYNKEWQICPAKENFIKNVHKCVMLVPDLKYATAAMNYIATKLPQGIDQLIAMEICLSLAQLWMKSADHVDEARGVFEKVKSKYLILSLKNILYKNGFGEQKYLEMIGHPEEIISSLYHDVTHFDSSVVVQKGGLNFVAEQIAELFSIDLEKLKLKLISKWISSKEEGASSLDMSCVGEMFAKEGSLNTATFNEEIRRLLHICKSMREEVVLAHLSSIFLPSLFTSVGLKIVLCIRELQGSQAVAAMLDLNERFASGVYFTKLYLLIQLEGLGIINSPGECESMGPRILVENILAKKPSHQISIFMAAKLCLSSNVFDLSLWSHIMCEMVKLAMFQELTQLLPLLRPHTSFLALQTYRDAWKEVVEAPFHVDKNSWTHEDEQKCFSSLRLLHLCPFLVDIDIQGMAEKCLKAGKVEMASLLLPYIPENQQIMLKKMLKMFGSPEDVTRRMQSLPPALQVYCHQVFTILSSNSA
ncbi:kinetochore-associated protein 1 [Hetaerina americana]|uniref:kinetochore-associated protein 1 n=1 Tax=Hetaerina americana TaxID=62018 RepID=UPI003A7F5D65